MHPSVLANGQLPLQPERSFEVQFETLTFGSAMRALVSPAAENQDPTAPPNASAPAPQPAKPPTLSELCRQLLADFKKNDTDFSVEALAKFEQNWQELRNKAIGGEAPALKALHALVFDLMRDELCNPRKALVRFNY